MNVALVGCGQWGKNLGRVLGDLGVLSVVVDSDRAARERAAESLGVPALGVLDEQALQCCEAVVVSTPAEDHFETAMRALQAGKHVLVEKPMTLRYYESCILLEQASDAGLALCVGHVVLFDAGFEFVQGLACGGSLGGLRHVYSERRAPGRVRRVEDAFFSLAAHDVSVVLALFGRRPSHVYASGASGCDDERLGAGLIDCSFGEARAQINVSWLATDKRRSLTVVGTKASASFDGESGMVGMRERVAGPAPYGPWLLRSRVVNAGEREPIRRELLAFLAYAAELSAREGATAPPHCAAKAIDVMAVLEAASRSLESREVVVL
jgi:predicted dehydrogenase